MITKRKTYYVLSGEGTVGRWQKKVCTDMGIKRILTTERCGGDRWAVAYHLAPGAAPVGIDIETGEARDLATAVSLLN